MKPTSPTIIYYGGTAEHLSEGELLYTGAKVEGNVASKSDRKAIKAARRISAP
jgi:hypothetical protein